MKQFAIACLNITLVCTYNVSAHSKISDHLLFDRAATYYKQHNFVQAIQSYESIAQKTNAVLFNKGLCHYYLGQYPESIALLRSAQKGMGLATYWRIENIINQIMQKAKIET